MYFISFIIFIHQNILVIFVLPKSLQIYLHISPFRFLRFDFFNRIIVLRRKVAPHPIYRHMQKMKSICESVIKSKSLLNFSLNERTVFSILFFGKDSFFRIIVIHVCEYADDITFYEKQLELSFNNYCFAIRDVARLIDTNMLLAMQDSSVSDFANSSADSSQGTLYVMAFVVTDHVSVLRFLFLFYIL